MIPNFCLNIWKHPFLQFVSFCPLSPPPKKNSHQAGPRPGWKPPVGLEDWGIEKAYGSFEAPELGRWVGVGGWWFSKGNGCNIWLVGLYTGEN